MYCVLEAFLLNATLIFTFNNNINNNNNNCLSTDEEYVRKQLRQADQENGESLRSLRWDAAILRKV